MKKTLPLFLCLAAFAAFSPAARAAADAVAAATPAITPEANPIQDALNHALPAWASAAVGTSLMLIGALRLVFKPLTTYFEARAKATPGTEDDEQIQRIEASWWYRLVAWLLDLTASVKVGPQKAGAIVTLLVLALLLPALPLTGCKGFTQDFKDAVARPAIQAGVKDAALIALKAGLSALGDRVNELQPFTDGISAKITIPFSRAATAVEAAAVLKDAVAQSGASPAQADQLVAAMRDSLQDQPAAGPNEPPAAAADARDFRQDVAAALANP